MTPAMARYRATEHGRAVCAAVARRYRATPAGRAGLIARNANGRAERRGAPGQLTAADVLAVISRPCAYCGTLEAVGVDHVLAMADGGANVPANLAPACLPCNRRREAIARGSRAYRLPLSSSPAAIRNRRYRARKRA